MNAYYTRRLLGKLTIYGIGTFSAVVLLLYYYKRQPAGLRCSTYIFHSDFVNDKTTAVRTV